MLTAYQNTRDLLLALLNNWIGLAAVRVRNAHVPPANVKTMHG